MRPAGVKARCMRGMMGFYFAIIALCVSGFLPGNVWASCSFLAGSTVTLTASLTGSITAGRDVPVGTELYRSQAVVNTNTNINCDALSVFNYSYASTPLPVSGYVSSTFGNQPIYQTNIPGIGVVAWAGSQSQAFPANFNSVGAGSNYSWGTHRFYFSLVKTASVVGSGAITASSLPTVQYRIGSNNLLVELGSASGSLNVITGTCATPDINVSMGTHLTSELTGVGSTTSQWVPVNIQLNNCPAFFGYWSSTNTDGATSTALIGANSIQYSISPSNGVANATNGVMNLSSGGATGMGIQLTNTSNAPVQFNKATPSGLTLNQTSSANYTINLQARYYQTGTSITAGAANATATVTLTYL
ncbi:fimbrial protein [Dyella dinghuensis]|nr:fimbrial protein [Dyella dinghuensis]